jgi:hypothetical protein
LKCSRYCSLKIDYKIIMRGVWAEFAFPESKKPSPPMGGGDIHFYVKTSVVLRDAHTSDSGCREVDPEEWFVENGDI